MPCLGINFSLEMNLPQFLPHQIFSWFFHQTTVLTPTGKYDTSIGLPAGGVTMQNQSHYSDRIKFHAFFPNFFQGRNFFFFKLNSDILYCDIVLDFYPVKIPTKCLGYKQV